MALYEHVFISRQDLTTSQTEDLIKQYSDILKDNGGKVIGHEYWGLRTLAYKINKNRKGHYILLNIDGPPEAILEYERLMRLDEDIIRFLTIKIKSIDEKSSPLAANKPDKQKNENIIDDSNLTFDDE